MSGEIVVLAGTPVGWAAMGVFGAFRAAQLAGEWVRHERALAERKMEQQKKSAGEWQQYHRAQQEAIRQATEQRAAVRRSLDALRLQSPHSAKTDDLRPRARGFVVPETKIVTDALNEVIERASRVPFAAPLQCLARQASKFDAELRSGTPPAAELIDELQTTVEQTVEQLLAESEARGRARQELLDRAETLFGDAIAYGHLAHEKDSREQLAELKDHLVRLLTSGGATAAKLTLLEQHFGRLKATIDQALEQRAIGEALRECAGNRLAGLGYRQITEAEGVSEWEVPGGERLRMALQPGQRIAFQLVHERSARSSEPLSTQELATLRRQEQRWCEDFHTLLQGLREDGIEIQVQLERETPEGTIPIVVLEDVEEWLEEEADRAAPAQRWIP